MKIDRLYTFWTGENDIPEKRKECLNSMINSGLNVVLINNKNIGEYLDLDSLHPAYFKLNLAHRADYLRAYFMHHYGGAYSDIKKINESWVPACERLSQSEKLYACGYAEINRHNVGNIYQSTMLRKDSKLNVNFSYIKWRWLQLNYKKTIGNCAFVFKPYSPITEAWWVELNRRLDVLLPELEEFSAGYPKERIGHFYDGVISKYPVPWTFILGDILQPLTLKYTAYVLKELPLPLFINYQ